MGDWLKLDDFIDETSYTKAEIARLVKAGEVEAKNMQGELYLRVVQKKVAPITPIAPSEVLSQAPKPQTPISQTTTATISSSTTFSSETNLAPIEKIFDLHTKCIVAKDEVINAYKQENEFLKKTLLGMQEMYVQDKKMVEFLREELEKNHQELEEFKKKYRLMWAKIGNFES